jgi:hypothetical protein
MRVSMAMPGEAETRIAVWANAQIIMLQRRKLRPARKI